jgi:hypothetical protein
MKPSVGKTSALTRSRTFSFSDRQDSHYDRQAGQ